MIAKSSTILQEVVIMKLWFKHNWLLRDQWYEWCQDVPYEELVKERTGGVGSIMRTLFHMIDVEWSWIQMIQGKPHDEENFEEYNTVDKIQELDRRYRLDITDFIENWNDNLETTPFYFHEPTGKVHVDAWGEIMRHTIAHQIHHLGQISVWAREMGKAPLSANVIGRGLIQPQSVQPKDV